MRYPSLGISILGLIAWTIMCGLLVFIVWRAENISTASKIIVSAIALGALVWYIIHYFLWVFSREGQYKSSNIEKWPPE
jgi:hypothetical protein